jgi:hypothetical protein
MKQDDLERLFRRYRDNIANMRISDEEANRAKAAAILSGRNTASVRKLVLRYPFQSALMAGVACNALLALFVPDVFRTLIASLPL